MRARSWRKNSSRSSSPPTRPPPRPPAAPPPRPPPARPLRGGEMPSEVAPPSREGVRAGEGLVREREGEVADPVLPAEREAPLRVVRRRLRPPEDGGHVGDMPLPDRHVDRGPELAPAVRSGG